VITRIEQCASGIRVVSLPYSVTGAIYCQIFDSIHTGYLPMRKVQWNAKFDYEFLPNYKLLQKGFLSAGVAKRIDVERLMKGRYQDNLEFCQFMMNYYIRERKLNCRPYDAVARRRLCGCPGFPEWAPTPTETRQRPGTGLPSTRASTVDLTQPLVDESKPAIEENLQWALLKAELERDFYFSKLEALESLIQSGKFSKESLLCEMYSTRDLDFEQADVVSHHCLSP
jgi:RP/EB family microtubule-associated protein